MSHYEISQLTTFFYKENIPNLSFSLNPPSPSLSKETKPKDERKKEPVENYGE